MTQSASLSGLYQDMILDHYRRPRNRGAPEHADAESQIKNPLCGDEITVWVGLTGDRVTDVRFDGRGCSISQASASMMTLLVHSLRVTEVRALIARVAELLRGDAVAAADPSLGDLRALSGVARYPVRARCASLAWEALARALQDARPIR
jgi:nitrogen fixation NifU-like protein